MFARILRPVFVSAVALATLGTLAGCGDGKLLKCHQVSGQVLVDGKPAAGLTVVFHPADPSKFPWNERPRGVTDEQGKFTLFTYQKGDGAPAGSYKVAVAYLPPADDEGNDQVKRSKSPVKVATRFAHPDQSGLTATVETRETELPPLNVTSN